MLGNQTQISPYLTASRLIPGMTGYDFPWVFHVSYTVMKQELRGLSSSNYNQLAGDSKQSKWLVMLLQVQNPSQLTLPLQDSVS